MSRDFIIYPALIGMLAISIPLFRSDETSQETNATVKTAKALALAEVSDQVAETVKKTEASETLAEQVEVRKQEQPIEKEIMLTSVPAERSTEPVAELIQQEPVAKSRKSTLFGRLCAAVKSQNDDELPIPPPTETEEHADHDHDHADHDHADHDHADHDHADHSHGDHDHHAHHDDHGHDDHNHGGHHHHDHADHSHSHGEQIYGESVVAPTEWAPMAAPVQLESAPMESYGVAIASDVSYAPAYSAPEMFCEPVHQPITIAPVVAPIIHTPIIVQQFVPAPVTYVYQPVYRKKTCRLLSGLHTHLRNLFARHIAKKRARWGFGRRSGCCY